MRGSAGLERGAPGAEIECARWIPSRSVLVAIHHELPLVLVRRPCAQVEFNADIRLQVHRVVRARDRLVNDGGTPDVEENGHELLDIGAELCRPHSLSLCNHLLGELGIVHRLVLNLGLALFRLGCGGIGGEATTRFLGSILGGLHARGCSICYGVTLSRRARSNTGGGGGNLSHGSGGCAIGAQVALAGLELLCGAGRRLRVKLRLAHRRCERGLVTRRHELFDLLRERVEPRLRLVHHVAEDGRRLVEQPFFLQLGRDAHELRDGAFT
mmetsp:Transcript_8265/g.27275  ORF Transcript_8265/g.27275 Transcript_8265/m.27275 type:complete len:270 (-) Transcript_8265:1816-2625(-)